MYRFIYKSWWKYLTIVILLFVFTAGFWVPLKPGLLSVSEPLLRSGDEFEVTVAGYNTRYESGEDITAYLRYDSAHIYPIGNVEVLDRKTLRLSGVVPDFRSDEDFESDFVSLYVHDPSEGYQILPGAFTVQFGEDASSSVAPGIFDLPTSGTEWRFEFPFRTILYESIRNMFFHVAIWMAMFVLLVVGLIYSIKYLRTKDLVHDTVASSFTHVAVLLGIIGMVTGSMWARFTWGAFWTTDPKLNGSAVAMIIYLAYSILRSSISSDDQRAKLSAAYNIFAFVSMIPLIFILPRLAPLSLHPGNGGNPAFGGEDLDSTLRIIFYPAIIGYTLLGVWVASILFRLRRINLTIINKELTA